MGACLDTHIATDRAVDRATAVVSCPIIPWLGIAGCLFYVLGSSRVDSGGKVVSATDETGGDDFEQATPASRFDTGSSPDTFRTTSNATYHLQRTAADPTVAYDDGRYSMAVRVISHGAFTRNIMGIKSDSASESVIFTSTGTTLRHSRYGTAAHQTDWDQAISSVVDGNFHTLGFSFDGTTTTFYVDGVEVGSDTQTAESITSIASALDQIGYISTGTQFTFGMAALWQTALTADNHAAIHAHAAALYP